MTYGTRPLDDEEFPKEIVVSPRVKADRLHLQYVITTPYDEDVRKLMNDYGLVYSSGARGWSISYRNVEKVIRVMEKAEAILASKDPAPEPVNETSDDSPSP